MISIHKRLAMYIYEKRQIDFFYSICLILAIFNCTIVQRSNKNQQRKKTAFLFAVFAFDGGDGRDRTDDLHTASVALSQLSYAPISSHTVDFIAFRHAFYIQLSNAFRGSLPVGMRSQLSYTPIWTICGARPLLRELL